MEAIIYNHYKLQKKTHKNLVVSEFSRIIVKDNNKPTKTMYTFTTMEEAMSALLINQKQSTSVAELSKGLMNLERNHVTEFQGAYYFLDEFGLLELA